MVYTGLITNTISFNGQTISDVPITYACAYNVLDYIDSTVSRPSDTDDLTWKRLDASVKQWIYGFISKNLLHTIMKLGATAMALWKSLEDIFQDNKHTKAVYLEEQCNTTRLENFTSMTEYCKTIKTHCRSIVQHRKPRH